jgi:hypothetical protein
MATAAINREEKGRFIRLINKYPINSASRANCGSNGKSLAVAGLPEEYKTTKNTNTISFFAEDEDGLDMKVGLEATLDFIKIFHHVVS